MTSARKSIIFDKIMRINIKESPEGLSFMFAVELNYEILLSRFNFDNDFIGFITVLCGQSNGRFSF